MGRGGAIYLSYTAFVLLSAASGTSAGLWDVDIDHGPAPPPDEGPPFSAHANRNRAHLPYEVIGVVGAYLATIIILFSLLLTLGRKLRKQALAMADNTTEMVKPMRRMYDPSPISPPASKWSLRKKKSTTSSVRSGMSNYNSPGIESVASFDQSVVERDRQLREEQMAQIYEQVLAQDNVPSPQAVVASQQLPSTAPPAYPQARPRALARVQTGESQTGPQSPTTPMSPSFYAIHPPRERREYNGPTSPYYYEQPRSPMRTNSHTRAPSYGSSQQAPEPSASPQKLRKGLRKSLKEHGLTISAPLRRDDNEDGLRTPLSPRFYTDPGIPPEPPTARTIDSQYPPTTPGTIRSFDYGDEAELGVSRGLPSPHPQRIEIPRAPPINTSGDFIMPAPSNRRGNSPISSTSNQLPLRQMNEQLKQQQATQHREAAYTKFPLSPARFHEMRSPGAATLSPTYVRSPGLKSPDIVRHDLVYKGSNLDAPVTGLPTVYSPYEPERFLIPLVTPSLPTKAERKQWEKEDNVVRGPIAEEDRVVNEKDMWGDAY